MYQVPKIAFTSFYFTQVINLQLFCVTSMMLIFWRFFYTAHRHVPSSTTQSLMQNLPPELQLHINRYLPVKDLSNLSLCSHYYHELSVPELYRELTVQMQVTGSNISSHKKMRTYTEDSFNKCKYLQSISVCGRGLSESAATFALRPICLLLGTILQARRPAELKFFEWKLDCPCEIDLVRNLPSSIAVLDVDARLMNCLNKVRHILDLRCHRICSEEQAYWLNKNIERSAWGLRRLSLSFESSQSTIQTQIILQTLRRVTDSSLGPSSLRYLGLANMDVSGWPGQEMPSLRHLNLQRCDHTEEALARFMDFNRHRMNLKRLDVSLTSPSIHFFGVLASLQGLAQLTSLQIILEGESEKFPIEIVLLSRRSLRHLSLESRRIGSDPTTVHPYEVQEFLEITDSCHLLTTLSIPIEIKRDSWRVLVKSSLFSRINLY